MNHVNHSDSMDPIEDSGRDTALPSDLITSSTRTDMSTQHRPQEPGLIYSALSVDDDVVLRGVPASQAHLTYTGATAKSTTSGLC